MLKRIYVENEIQPVPDIPININSNRVFRYASSTIKPDK